MSTTKYFLVWVTYCDGEHEHTYRGVIRGGSEQDVLARAPVAALAWFGFFNDPADPYEREQQAAAIEIGDITEISAADSEVVLRLGVVSDLDEETVE
jgi:hypothetical protein